jgi:hypothetical protein
MSRFPLARWEPWVGHDYENNGIDGRRLLIIGESHYVGSRQEFAEIRASRTFTQEVVERQWTTASWSYFTKIAKAVTGEEEPDKRTFWNKVAFYNYVQDIVGTGPRERPTKRLWKEAADILPSVIDELRPHYILATGKGLWNQLPIDWETAEPLNVRNWETCVGRTVDGYPFRATYMIHPSSRYCGGGLDWAPLVRAFLQLPLRD